MKSRLLIVSDGTGRGTRFIDTETNQDVTELFKCLSIGLPPISGTSVVPATVTLALYADIQLNTDQPRAEVKTPTPPADRSERW